MSKISGRLLERMKVFFKKMEAHQNHSMTPEADTIPGPAVFLAHFCVVGTALCPRKVSHHWRQVTQQWKPPRRRARKPRSSQPTVNHWPRHGHGQTTKAPAHFQVLLAPLSPHSSTPQMASSYQPPLAPQYWPPRKCALSLFLARKHRKEPIILKRWLQLVKHYGSRYLILFPKAKYPLLVLSSINKNWYIGAARMTHEIFLKRHKLWQNEAMAPESKPAAWHCRSTRLLRKFLVEIK